MKKKEQAGSQSRTARVMILTVIFSTALLVLLSQLGLIAFTGTGWIVNTVNMISGHLGYSTVFFIPVFTGFGYYFVQLSSSISKFKTDPDQMERIRYFNAGTEIFIVLSFAIGVLFTAWGLQNALVSALGDGMGEKEAGRIGAWGILKRLVDNGFLIAFWTTIVGGTAGYIMRLFKFLSLGKKLSKISEWQGQQDRQNLIAFLNSINSHAEQINKRLTQPSKKRY
jgi:hypothetical protein